MAYRSEARQFLKNRYFLIGLAVQKGAPILLLPVIVAATGRTVYSEYVLFYSVVQTVAVATSLGIPQALIPFWYAEEDKPTFVASLLGLLALAALTLAVPAAIVSALLLKENLASVLAPAVGLALAFTFVYNVNALSLNLVRAQQRQVSFLWSSVASAVLLLILVLLIGKIPGNKLLWLAGANIASAAFQSLLLIPKSAMAVRLPHGDARRRFAERVLRFSVPLTLYTFVGLLGLVVDKWIVSAYFSSALFAQYVLDFQFAFTVMLVSVVIGMYNSQRVAEIVHQNDARALRSNTIGNYALSAAMSVAGAAASFAYAWVTGIGLSAGYWILASAFLLNNLYAVNSNVLTAQKQSKALALLGTVMTGGFVLALLAASSAGSIQYVYAGYVLYYASMFLASGICIRRVFRGIPEPSPRVAARA